MRNVPSKMPIWMFCQNCIVLNINVYMIPRLYGALGLTQAQHIALLSGTVETASSEHNLVLEWDNGQDLLHHRIHHRIHHQIHHQIHH
jgi:hypothetical protein